MTVLELTTEILNRCGEGYENWTDRAKETFHASVVSLIMSNQYDPYDYHGLIREISHTVSGTPTSVDITILIPDDFGFIRFIDIKKTTGSVVSRVDLVSYVEKLATDFNAELKADVLQWYFLSDETGNYINFGAALANDDTITCTAIVWINALLDVDATLVSDYMTEQFIQDAITLSVQNLKKELVA